jgi:hypothetical protein
MGYNFIGRVEVKDRKGVLSLVILDRSECCSLSFHFLNLNRNIRLQSLYDVHDDRLKEAPSKNQDQLGGVK